ncbi:Deoxynucleoside kinase [Echinococcus granulosus]|nr:Deoxynucleoside kinase [Echinococcus granulosus]
MEVSRTFNVAVEGNIGCGKSTFLNYFKGLSPKIQISLEPIVLWNDVKGFKLFEVFYGDPNRWSTPFESQVMATFFERQAEKQTAPVRLLERSVHTCRYCFIEAMNRNRQLSDEDLEVFDKFYDWGMSFPTSKLDLIVYLRCSPEICAERIRKRDRRGESAISMCCCNGISALKYLDCFGVWFLLWDTSLDAKFALWKDKLSNHQDYLNQLHDLHEDWLLGTKRDCVGAPVMVFDCDEPLEVLTDVYFQRRDQVLCGVPV